jgi:hypothetical protein
VLLIALGSRDSTSSSLATAVGSGINEALRLQLTLDAIDFSARPGWATLGAPDGF